MNPDKKHIIIRIMSTDQNLISALNEWIEMFDEYSISSSSKEDKAINDKVTATIKNLRDILIARNNVMHSMIPA